MFIPPHWHHKNIKFPKKEIDIVSSKLKQIPIPLKNNCFTTFYQDTLRPESIWYENYSEILEDILSSIGIHQNGKYDYYYWSQLYVDGSSHGVHNHVPNSDISFVHFIQVPEEPLFRFTNTVGDYYIPHQFEGDILCFPSWVWHEVIANKSNTERLIVSGNITITDMSPTPLENSN